VFRCVAAPLQPPEIVGTSSSSTSIHLKWKSPFFIGAPLIGYQLTVSSSEVAAAGHLPTSAAITRVKEIIVQPSSTASSSANVDEVFSDVVTMLRPDVEYRITLSALNQYGVGPPVVLTVRTQLFSSSKWNIDLSIYSECERIEYYQCPLNCILI